MGINDRDYMRDEPDSSGFGFTNMFRVCAVVALMVILFICLRIPAPFVVKILLLCLAPLIGLWLFSIPNRIEGDMFLERGRQLERDGKADAAIINYEQALKKSPKDSAIKLRLLSSYNSELQVNKAKDFINRLNGQTFHKDEIKEVEAIISQYRKVKSTNSGNRHRVVLMD